ncbi:interleukin-3 receptor subunit alpha [Phyllostomus discolor]|uniref:Interleukin-3 receptor subunit alpha n=1 Tax=Phyllostomus discolor TaxID=89673 RepID=A0A7E6D4B0_9CHIR|nr:interleukin-3 receptor subunit alpha [Phyllostomus discolor]
MALLRLLVVLTPVCCVLPTNGDGSPPIANLRLDQGTKRLTWDLSGNVSRIKCYVDGDYLGPAMNNRYCLLNVLPKCEPWNYTVLITVPGGKLFSAWVDYPTREGNPRAAAEHLRCRVHDLHFLTCSWTVGAEAPGDVQYEFYLEDLRTSQKWPCPHYTKEEPGTRVGCQFADLSELLAEEDEKRYFRFVVQGTSGGSRVPCSEIFQSLSEIEELVAPNLTTACNKSLAVLRWTMFSHFTRFFDYELKIHKDSGAPITDKNLSEEFWSLPNPGTFTVTVRAHGGLWSAPQRFGLRERERACGGGGGRDKGGSSPAARPRPAGPGWLLPPARRGIRMTCYLFGEGKKIKNWRRRGSLPSGQDRARWSQSQVSLSGGASVSRGGSRRVGGIRVDPGAQGPVAPMGRAPCAGHPSVCPPVCDPEDKTPLYVWLIALATLLAVGAAILLCKKCSLLHKLFPPIPHMKDPIADNRVHEKMMAWQAGAPAPEDCPVAEVQLVKST